LVIVERTIFSMYQPGHLALQLNKDALLERKEVVLPETEAGAEIAIALTFSESLGPLAVKFDVLRSAGFSAYTRNWRP
jgi:hypothetical protein